MANTHNNRRHFFAAGFFFKSLISILPNFVFCGGNNRIYMCYIEAGTPGCKTTEGLQGTSISSHVPELPSQWVRLAGWRQRSSKGECHRHRNALRH